jgi:hypothetical protein
MPRWAVRHQASDIPDKNRGQASFDPSHISNDHEEAGGADGDKGAGHSDPHRNSNDSKAHAGGLTLSKTIEFPRAKRVHKCGEHLLPQGNPACNRVVVCPIPDTRFSEI